MEHDCALNMLQPGGRMVRLVSTKTTVENQNSIKYIGVSISFYFVIYHVAIEVLFHFYKICESLNAKKEHVYISKNVEERGNTKICLWKQLII